MMASSASTARSAAPGEEDGAAEPPPPPPASQPACNQCRTRKVRCDRETPYCSNCRKASLPCDFNTKSKRVNQTKQLAEDFSSLGTRLESIDASIAKLTHHIGRSNGSSARPATSPLDTNLADDDLSWVRRVSSTRAGSTASTASSPPGNNGSSTHSTNPYLHSIDISGRETYYGPTSAPSLLGRSRAMVKAALRGDALDHDGDETMENRPGNAPRLPAAVISSEQGRNGLETLATGFPYPDICARVIISGCGKPVSKPPRPFLEPAVDCYLQDNNRVTPLFEENSLRAAITDLYDGPDNADAGAWSLCFNNIIVLVTGVRLRHTKLMGLQSPDLDEDIFIPFLANSQRAFNHLDDYSEPRLVNVQALTTLALVAAEYFSYCIFERLLQRACSLAQEMGLQHRYCGKTNDPVVVEEQRRAVFWSLYVLDKMRTSVTGQACELYLFESDLDLPLAMQLDICSKHCVARVNMMLIWEEIWLGLYSSRARRTSPVQIKRQISRLSGHLREWAAENQTVLQKPEAGNIDQETCLRLELRYAFHVGQALIYRCGDDRKSHQWRLNNARASLSIIANVYNSVHTMSAICLLGKIFRFYSIVAFYDVHLQHVLEPNEAEYASDMVLLQTSLAAVQMLKHPTMDSLYYNKVADGMAWCLRLNEVVRCATRMAQSQSSTSVRSSHVKRTSPLDSGSAGSDTDLSTRVVRRKTLPNASSQNYTPDSCPCPPMDSGTNTRGSSPGFMADLSSLERAQPFNFTSETNDNGASRHQLDELMIGQPNFLLSPFPTHVASLDAAQRGDRGKPDQMLQQLHSLTCAAGSGAMTLPQGTTSSRHALSNGAVADPLNAHMQNPTLSNASADYRLAAPPTMMNTTLPRSDPSGAAPPQPCFGSEKDVGLSAIDVLDDTFGTDFLGDPFSMPICDDLDKYTFGGAHEYLTNIEG